MENSIEAQAYHRIKDRLFFVGLFLNLAVFAFLLISGLSVQLRDLSSGFSPNFLVINSFYITLFALGMYGIHFPLNLFEGFFLEHKFKLSKQSFASWLAEDFKKGVLSFLILLLLLNVIYLALRQWPGTWWLAAGGFWLLLTLILAKITPTVIIPIFYKYSRIENDRLRTKVLALFERCGLPVKDVYVINFSVKTKKANAFICGLGKNRRVVLTDTLVSDFSPEEIETVVAHELGHYKHRDIVKITLVHSAVILASFFLISKLLQATLPEFGLTRMDDIAFFPMMALAFLVLGLLVTPFLNAYSRGLEVQADKFSLMLTNDAAGFISMLRKLGTMNLAEFRPSLWKEIFFYDHPPIAKRLKFAESFGEDPTRQGIS